MKDLEELPLPENEGKRRGKYVQDVIHQEAIKFIEANQDRPFFAYLPYIMPHVELLAPPEARREYGFPGARREHRRDLDGDPGLFEQGRVVGRNVAPAAVLPDLDPNVSALDVRPSGEDDQAGGDADGVAGGWLRGAGNDGR
jgi:hypothetical protein